MRGSDRSAIARRALDNIASRARRSAAGSRITITVGDDIDEEHDPNAEDWEKVDDDDPTFPGRSRKHRSGGS